MPPRDLLLVLLICLAWALNFLTSAHALREIPPLLFTALRFVMLALPLLYFLKRPAAGQWPRLIAVCLCVGVAHFGLSFLALQVAGNLSSPAIVMQSYVPMTAVLAWWVLGERFGWRTTLAIGVSFAGVMVLGLDPLVFERPLALLMMLVSAFFLALGTVLMKGLRGLDVFSQQCWTALIAVLPLLGLSVAFEPGAFAQLQSATWIGWGGVAYSAFMSSLLGHGLYYVLIQRHPVALVMPWLLLTPVFAVALGIVFWGDRPGPAMWVGGAMVLGGVLMVALRAIAKAREVPAMDTL